MKIKTFDKNNVLKGLIKSKQKDMYSKAKHYGFTHPIVVACSQELDSLLNRYQNLRQFNHVS